MDCETCTDHLVELLYEELDEEDAARARTHLAECEACAASFSRIRAGHALAARLEQLDPPVAVRSAVLAAARERAAERAPAPVSEPEPAATPAQPEPIEEDGAWAALLRWLGSFAMRPQLAMALSLLLIVGLGMWYLPALRDGDPADLHAIVDPAPGDEVGPSAALVPAEPLPRTEPAGARSRARDEADVPPRGATRPTPAALDEAVAVAPPDPDARERAAAESGRAARPSPGTSIEEADLDPRAQELAVAPGQTAELRPAPAEPQATQPAPTAPAMVAEDSERSPAATTDDSSTDRYGRGLANYRQRNYREAASDFESVIERPGPDPRLIPSALHHLARSQRGAGNCAAAVRSYERLLAQHPTYSGSGEALLEGAGCYQRLGRLGEARAWLERARAIPSVAAQANRMLVVLAQQERGAGAITVEGNGPASSTPAQ
ncbi:MAG: tetratricopeptide repeat protein [Sandaracinaceae bacterium]|nr:tetratricopeptide repeat protein [Sandaracinaceae bacterium]